MKLKKTLVSAFVVTFFIGYVSVLPGLKIQRPAEQTEIPAAELLQPPPAENAPELETIEEVNGWVDGERKAAGAIDREGYPLKIKLLQTGDGFHGDEVEARNGENWLGLFEENGEFHLRSTKLKIERVVDPIVDQEGKKKTGKSVAVSDKKDPVFLVKNASKLKTGKVTSFFKGVEWRDYLKDYEDSEISSDEVLTNLRKNFAQTYEIGGKKYELRVIEAKDKTGERILALTLKSGENRQILHTIRFDYSSDVGTLYWVGDLDHDDKPDFFLELYEHDNVDNKVLFLSSEAEKGELVKKAAYFWTTGC